MTTPGKWLGVEHTEWPMYDKLKVGSTKTDNIDVVFCAHKLHCLDVEFMGWLYAVLPSLIMIIFGDMWQI